MSIARRMIKMTMTMIILLSAPVDFKILFNLF